MSFCYLFIYEIETIQSLHTINKFYPYLTCNPQLSDALPECL